MPDLITLQQTDERGQAMAADGRADLGGLWLGRCFLEDLAGWDIYGRAARFQGRVLLLHGDADPSVPLEASIRYQAIYGDHAELRVIAGADHTFNRASWGAEVIRRTVAFLCEESRATPWP